MDFRYINVLERDLNNNKSRVQPYSFLDKIPPDVYTHMQDSIKEETITLENFTICLSVADGSDTVKLSKYRGRGKLYFGILELELRGAFVNYDEDTITLNKNFLPVVHLILDEYAVSIHDNSFVKNITIDDVCKFILNNTEGKKIQLVDEPVYHEEIFPNVTRYFTKKEDLLGFYEELESTNFIKNIVTTPVTYQEVSLEMESADIFE